MRAGGHVWSIWSCLIKCCRRFSPVLACLIFAHKNTPPVSQRGIVSSGLNAWILSPRHDRPQDDVVRHVMEAVLTFHLVAKLHCEARPQAQLINGQSILKPEVEVIDHQV